MLCTLLDFGARIVAGTLRHERASECISTRSGDRDPAPDVRVSVQDFGILNFPAGQGNCPGLARDLGGSPRQPQLATPSLSSRKPNRLGGAGGADADKRGQGRYRRLPEARG